MDSCLLMHLNSWKIRMRAKSVWPARVLWTPDTLRALFENFCFRQFHVPNEAFAFCTGMSWWESRPLLKFYQWTEESKVISLPFFEYCLIIPSRDNWSLGLIRTHLENFSWPLEWTGLHQMVSHFKTWSQRNTTHLLSSCTSWVLCYASNILSIFFRNNV